MRFGPSVFFLLAMVGCDQTSSSFEDERDLAGVPADAPVDAGLRGGPILSLELVGPFAPGATGTVNVTGDVSIDTIRVVRGQSPGASCPAILGGDCLDLDNARLQFSAPADAEGDASFSMSIPLGVSVGLELCMQALQGNSAPFTFSDVECAPIEAPEPCHLVEGINWCFHPTECGRACNDTCAANGLSAMADSTTWYEAQDTVDECQAIATAFGSTAPVSFSSYTWACMEDSNGRHTSDGGLNDSPFGLFCSSDPNCIDAHRTDMDDLGIPCGPASRRSICPCE